MRLRLRRPEARAASAGENHGIEERKLPDRSPRCVAISLTAQPPAEQRFNLTLAGARLIPYSGALPARSALSPVCHISCGQRHAHDLKLPLRHSALSRTGRNDHSFAGGEADRLHACHSTIPTPSIATTICGERRLRLRDADKAPRPDLSTSRTASELRRFGTALRPGTFPAFVCSWSPPCLRRYAVRADVRSHTAIVISEVLGLDQNRHPRADGVHGSGTTWRMLTLVGVDPARQVLRRRFRDSFLGFSRSFQTQSPARPALRFAARRVPASVLPHGSPTLRACWSSGSNLNGELCRRNRREFHQQAISVPHTTLRSHQFAPVLLGSPPAMRPAIGPLATRSLPTSASFRRLVP